MYQGVIHALSDMNLRVSEGRPGGCLARIQWGGKVYYAEGNFKIFCLLRTAAL